MEPPPQEPTRVRYAVLAALCSLAFITYLDRICIAQVQLDIARDLRFGELSDEDEAEIAALEQAHAPANLAAAGGGLNQGFVVEYARAKRSDEHVNNRLAWMFTAFLVGYVLFEIPGGWLGDVWGPRGVIVRIVIWWSIFTALTGSVDTVVGWFASSPTPWMLLSTMVLVRFLFGLGEAGAYPNVGRALARWFPYRDRAKAQGFIWLSSRLGGFVAPMVIVGVLKPWLGGWREAFWFLGGVGVLWSIWFFFWFRDRPEEKANVNDAERELIRAGSERGSVYDDAHKGLKWSRLFLSWNLWAVYFAAAAISFAWYFYVTLFPKYLNDKFKYSPDESWTVTGLPLLVGGASCFIGGWLSDYLVRRTHSKRWGRSLVCLFAFGGAGLCVLLMPHASAPWQAITVVCLVCAIQDLSVPVIWSIGADIGGRYAGTVCGCINAIGALGGALSPFAASRIANSYGWDALFVVFAIVYVLGALTFLRVNAAETITADDKPHAHPTPAT